MYLNMNLKKLTNRESGLREVIETGSSKYYKECKARSAERIYIREHFETAA
jgi:hypothetical protein